MNAPFFETEPGGKNRPWQTVRRILAVRLDNMGDVLMTTPALTAIRHALPDVHLTLLTSPSGAALDGHLPMVNEVISYEAPWVKPSADASAMTNLDSDQELIRQLVAGAFDGAVIFTVSTQNPLPAAFLCYLAGIPWRAAHCRENPYQLLTHWVPDREVVETGMRHEVERQLALVASLGWPPADQRLVFQYREAHMRAARDQLASHGALPDAPYAVVHPGATAASRRYPAESFGRAADLLARASGLQIVFTGSAGESDLIARARSVMSEPSVSMAGKLGLGDFAALVAGARLLLSNNTGPVHIAAAVGTPVVDLYALTNPQHTPWKVPSRVLNHPVPCRNCLKSQCPQGHHACLRMVGPGEVATAGLELLGNPEMTGHC